MTHVYAALPLAFSDYLGVAMATGSHFHAGDRVQALRPMSVFDANRSGIILRVYSALDVSDVVFDGQTEPHLVGHENLSLVAAAQGRKRKA